MFDQIKEWLSGLLGNHVEDAQQHLENLNPAEHLQDAAGQVGEQAQNLQEQAGNVTDQVTQAKDNLINK